MSNLSILGRELKRRREMQRPAKLTEKAAHKAYDQILNQLVKPAILGNRSTYGSDLERVAIKMMGSQFKGVFPSDKIPRLNALKPYAILNLDRSDQPGSHWIAIAFSNGKTYVYDSFGRKSSRIIPTLTHGRGIVDSDYDAEQDVLEENCGPRSLAWLLFFNAMGAKNAILI